jgi:ferredoxin
MVSEIMTYNGIYRLDKSVCIASGNCVVHAQGLFRQDANGLAEFVRPPTGHDEEHQVSEALLDCPSGAITFTDRSDEPR